MSDIQRRIDQFRNMAQADPDNEMAHFSLGKALSDAGRHAEAAECFVKCTELAPQMSKAFQLAAENLVKAGNPALAAQLATRGYTIAAERGDLMPKNALADLLASLGKPVPEVTGKGASAAGSRDVNLLSPSAPAKYEGPIPAGAFVCASSGRPGTKMTRPPFKGPVGQWIFQNISQETFDSWIRQGTKVINELRLDLSREEDEAVYDQHMREYLGIDEELFQKLTSTNPTTSA